MRKPASSRSERRGRAAPRVRDALRRERALAVLMKFRLVINAAKRHFRWIETRCGLSGSQVWVLWEVERRPGLRVSELAAAMAVHQSTASNLVEPLEKAGLLRRYRSSDDQRMVNLAVTDAGSAVLRNAPQPARGILTEALHGLPLSALAGLDQSLARVLFEMKRCGRLSGGQILLGDVLSSRD